MESARSRRSPRLAMVLPVRVFGFDYHGIDFVQDGSTTVVNKHGAKIWLNRKLVPDQEIRILCQATQREGIFRVVSCTTGTEKDSVFWGVECLEAGPNIWGIEFPDAGLQDQRFVRIMIQCPECRARELLHTEERFAGVVQEMGGLLRNCRVCGKSALWKPVPYAEV